MTITASGTGSLTYSIDNGASFFANGGVFNSVIAGSYTVVVKDGNGCTTTYGSNPVVLSEPSVIVATATATANVTCNGGSDGVIALSVNGGSSPYSFLWSPGGATTQNINSLAAGAYTVVVTDNNNCTQSAGATVSQPTPVVASIGALTAVRSGPGGGVDCERIRTIC